MASLDEYVKRIYRLLGSSVGEKFAIHATGRSKDGSPMVTVAFNMKPMAKNVPVRLVTQVIATPYGAVIRLKIVICDVPSNPLAIEVFFNPANEHDRRALQILKNQKILPIAFTKEDKVIDRMSITITKNEFGNLDTYLEIADRFNRGIKELDFSKAKEYAIKNTPILALDDTLVCMLASIT